MAKPFRHIPVLLNAVLEALRPRPGMIFVDCPLGLAGHGCSIQRVDRVKPGQNVDLSGYLAEGGLLGARQKILRAEEARVSDRNATNPNGDAAVFGGKDHGLGARQESLGPDTRFIDIETDQLPEHALRRWRRSERLRAQERARRGRR